MEKNAALYDLFMDAAGAIYTALAGAAPPKPAPVLLQLRAGLAESPGWFLVQASEFGPGTLSDMEKAQDEMGKIEEYLEVRHPDILDQMAVKRMDDPEHSTKKLVITSEVNGSFRETVIDTAFLASPEYRELLGLKESLKAFGPPPYSLQIGDETLTAHTYQQVLKLALDDAQKGLTIQRYKGLGEMNPDQLWRTTMNPETRTLVRVNSEDTVEADRIFTILMGEQVEPRRQFIEENALAVKNLDI